MKMFVRGAAFSAIVSAGAAVTLETFLHYRLVDRDCNRTSTSNHYPHIAQRPWPCLPARVRWCLRGGPVGVCPLGVPSMERRQETANDAPWGHAPPPSCTTTGRERYGASSSVRISARKGRAWSGNMLSTARALPPPSPEDAAPAITTHTAAERSVLEALLLQVHDYQGSPAPRRNK